MSVIFAVLLFSFLIFIHELGHFLAAKLSGVQVNEFALFMGPAIFKWKRAETEYSIRCIPIGGYCAMEGENLDTDNPRSFQKAAWWKRLIILVAGAAMNLVAGVAILAIVLAPSKMYGVPQIATMEETSLVGGENGLQVGDRFLEVDGEKIYLYSDVSMLLSLNEGEVHDLVIERNAEKIVLNDFVMKKAEFTNSDGTKSIRYGFTFAAVDATFGNFLDQLAKTSLNVIRTVRLSLQMLINGQAGLQDMSGPVGIVQMMSDTAASSDSTFDALMDMLYFGGFIAINLAVMNMLPIPALDGGRTVCLLITVAVEAITKKKINPKFEGYLHGIGMVLLLILMGVIMFKDIFTIFKG